MERAPARTGIRTLRLATQVYALCDCPRRTRTPPMPQGAQVARRDARGPVESPAPPHGCTKVSAGRESAVRDKTKAREPNTRLEATCPDTQIHIDTHRHKYTHIHIHTPARTRIRTRTHTNTHTRKHKSILALVLVVGNHIGAAKPNLRGWQGARAELASKPTQQVGAAGPFNKRECHLEIGSTGLPRSHCT